MRTLTIISHTEHYKLPNGSIVGLGSTITEINHLLSIFDLIYHVAMLHEKKAPPSALPYLSDKITFVALPVVGGSRFIDKMAIVYKAPHIINTIKKTITKTDYFQFRAPTGIGVYVIPYLVYLSKKKGWFKYAGNWKQKNAPVVYRFQRWLLKNQTQKVTINGLWPNQRRQCLSFENPCLTELELELGEKLVINKGLKYPLQLCFVGRLEKAKGLDLIIEAITALDPVNRAKIGTLHLVGEGISTEDYKKKVNDLQLPIVFHGYLSRKDVHNIYKKCHAILLPSASEGFPKVIAEAMNYGCVPIVTNVSSIGHYIKDERNGFLIKTLNREYLKEILIKFLKLSQIEFKSMISSDRELLHKFNYHYYNQRIKFEIL